MGLVEVLLMEDTINIIELATFLADALHPFKVKLVDGFRIVKVKSVLEHSQLLVNRESGRHFPEFEDRLAIGHVNEAEITLVSEDKVFAAVQLERSECFLALVDQASLNEEVDSTLDRGVWR